MATTLLASAAAGNALLFGRGGHEGHKRQNYQSLRDRSAKEARLKASVASRTVTATAYFHHIPLSRSRAAAADRRMKPAILSGSAFRTAIPRNWVACAGMVPTQRIWYRA